MEEKIKKLEEHLNYVWKLIPNKPTYGEFNKNFIIKNTNILRNFENQQPWFGIAKYGTKNEGISILTMFASITDYLTDGWRLSFVLKEDKNISFDKQEIIGFQMIKYQYSESSGL